MSVFKFGTLKSPPRRPTVQGSEQSPFCTSPSQLQEVTLDTDYSGNGTIPFTLGLRSPGKTSPLRGRTMKEYEEQLSQLKKENFNLKLRIYFLDERMGQMSRNTVDDKEDHIKENIELKVESESLRKEVSDKQELLCQAAKALDVLEEQHRTELKKLKEDHNIEKDILSAHIEELEKKLNTFKDQAKKLEFLKLKATGDVHSQEKIEQFERQIADLTSQIQRLEQSLEGKTLHASKLEADLQELQQESKLLAQRCEGLEMELKQRDEKVKELVQELEQRGQDLAKSNLSIQALEDSLSIKDLEIQNKVQELGERERIIKEKLNHIEQQNKILVETKIKLDEKERYIETLRIALATRDSTVAELETALSKAKTNVYNLEAKLNAAKHESKRLREEADIMKQQQKCRSNSSREQLADDGLSPSRRRSCSTLASTAEMSSPGRTYLNSDDESKFRKQLSDVSLNEKQSITMEEWKKEDSLSNETTQLQIKSIELQSMEAVNKLRDAEEILRKKECHLKEIDDERMKAFQAIKGFMKKNKDLNRELDQLKAEMKKRDHHINDLVSEVNELRDACNKANWEACQLQAQAQVQGCCGKPGAIEDVRDMTEEENERLWAELEDKKKKLDEVTTERDNLATEMEKQLQNMLTALKDKETSLQECEKKYAASTAELEARNKHIQELNEELTQISKKLKAIEKDLEEKSRAETEDKKCSDEKLEKIGSLNVDLEDKKEVEHPKIELKKQNGNLQELVNKELWDKNKKMELLQDAEKNEVEVKLLQQKLNARDIEVQLLQEKLSELGMQVNLPTSLALKEIQQQQQVGAYFVQRMHMAGDAEHNTDQLQSWWDERKYLCQKVEELREKLRNTPERDSDSRALRTEITKLREELQKADSWRRNATDVCSKLTQRLEELSVFLAALLKHPDQLNGLGIERRLMLRQAVERSMEMSHSLSITLSTTNQEFNETTLTSISSILITSDLNISELFKDSDNLEITSSNKENFSSEVHVEGNNYTENVSVKTLDHAESVNNLQFQAEAQQEVGQNNEENELPSKIADKMLLVTADSVKKSETEDNNSLSSMTFYNSSIVGKHCGCGAVVLRENKQSGSSSLPDSDVELTNEITASCHVQTPPKRSQSKKATSVNKARRGSSASTIPLSQVVPAVSDSEAAWSEPDRRVSQARIGLSEEANNNMNVEPSHCGKIIKMEDNSSNSSEETTCEIIRTPGKSVYNDAAEIRRLQNKLRGLGHWNAVLRAELSIMHQLTPHGNKSVIDCNQNMSDISALVADSSANALTSPKKDVNTNANLSVGISVIETKESSHEMELPEESTDMKTIMNISATTENLLKSAAVPLHLLEQIKFQREKLELLLHHNNLIRDHLEKMFVSLSIKHNDVSFKASKRAKDYAEQLEEARKQSLRQEHQLIELNLQLEQSLQQEKLTNEKLMVTENNLKLLKEFTSNFWNILKDQFIQVSGLKTVMRKLEDECKEKDVQLLNMGHELCKLKEDYTKQLQETQRLKKETDVKLQEALKFQEDAKNKLAKTEKELSSYKVLLERQNLEKMNLQKEKDESVKKFEVMLREVHQQREEVEYQNSEVRKKIQKAELQRLEAERIVTEVQQNAEKFKEECKNHAEKLIEKQKKELEKQLQLRICEEQKRLEDLYKKEEEARISVYEAKLKQQEKDIQNKAENKIKSLEEDHKKTVLELKRKIHETEMCVHTRERDLKKKLEEALLSNSKLTVEKTRLYNEKLHLEQEVRKQEALKLDLVHERKEIENSLAAMKKEMEKETSSVEELTQDKKELERRVKDMEAINDELMKRLCIFNSKKLHAGDCVSEVLPGGESAAIKALGTASPRGCLSTTDGVSAGPVSLRTNISVVEDQSTGKGSVSTRSTLIVHKGFARLQNENSDPIPENQALEEREAVFTQMKKSEVDDRNVWTTTHAEQRSTPSLDNARNLTSPDLGIESDQGRFSSLEASSSAPPEFPHTEALCVPTKNTGVKDYKQLEKENIILKQRLLRTRRALEQTAVQLSEANQRKKDVEKSICKQLNRTQHILKQTRANLDIHPQVENKN